MAVYAVGDIQGCLEQLERLLERLNFDPTVDKLWLTGDLVNRGPNSLGVLRLIKSLGDRAVTVLGNHDLHLLAVWTGHGRLKKNDSLAQVLDAPDSGELLDWLRHRPLLHNEPELNTVMVHAGLFPFWSFEQAQAYAAEAEQMLRSNDWVELMRHLYGDEPAQWNDTLSGWERLRFIVNAFTRMRYCAPTGELRLQFKGAPQDAPSGNIPWFRVPGRFHPQGLRVIFGHWSTLGFVCENGVVALDTGCLWGGQLTAVRLDGELVRTSIECPISMAIGSDTHNY